MDSVRSLDVNEDDKLSEGKKSARSLKSRSVFGKSVLGGWRWVSKRGKSKNKVNRQIALPEETDETEEG